MQNYYNRYIHMVLTCNYSPYLKKGPEKMLFPHLMLKIANNLQQKLKKTYGEAVVEHTPEYASVFAGTLFEETYINSADLSFMAPAMIWPLIWKHAGLLLSPDTLLLTNLKSYYNFVLLNVTANSSTTALTQFTDRHHELPGNFISLKIP